MAVRMRRFGCAGKGRTSCADAGRGGRRYRLRDPPPGPLPGPPPGPHLDRLRIAEVGQNPLNYSFLAAAAAVPAGKPGRQTPLEDPLAPIRASGEGSHKLPCGWSRIPPVASHVRRPPHTKRGATGRSQAEARPKGGAAGVLQGRPRCPECSARCPACHVRPGAIRCLVNCRSTRGRSTRGQPRSSPFTAFYSPLTDSPP